MTLDDVLNRLGEWKERILFGVVLLITVLISLNAEPLGGGVADIDSEVRAASATAAGASSEITERAIRLLERPAEITPTAPSQDDINRPFYDERDVFVRGGRASAWSLTVQEYRSLPPITLDAPGFAQLHDFDAPAGLRPTLSRLDGYIPRDTRRVELKAEERSEFED
jgi:hypothetical protein